jgi:hypothetical protein
MCARDERRRELLGSRSTHGTFLFLFSLFRQTQKKAGRLRLSCTGTPCRPRPVLLSTKNRDEPTRQSQTEEPRSECNGSVWHAMAADTQRSVGSRARSQRAGGRLGGQAGHQFRPTHGPSAEGQALVAVLHVPRGAPVIPGQRQLRARPKHQSRPAVGALLALFQSPPPLIRFLILLTVAACCLFLLISKKTEG